MSNLVQRTLTGILFVAVLLGAVLFNPLTFGLIFLVVTLLALAEFYQLASIKGKNPLLFPGIITGAYVFLANFMYAGGLAGPKVFLPLIPAFLLLYIIELYRKKDIPVSNLAFTIMGIVYIVVPFSLMNYIVFDPETHTFQSFIVVGFFILIWTYDTGAYVFGMLFGKHRLFERISPKKSWEGLVGGLFCSIGAAMIIASFDHAMGKTEWLVIAFIIVVFGTYGDMVESLFKRSVNVKDSGKMLPGHGGMLDRFDSLLFAAPAIFAYLQFLK